MVDPHDDPGLQLDLKQMGVNPARREVLLWLGAAALAPLVGCAGDKGDERGSDSVGGDSDGTGDSGGGDSSGGDSSGADSSGGDSSGGDSAAETCEPLPRETAGPFPGDGSNGANVLALDDVVRSDIRTSIGELTGTAQGVELKVRLRVVDATSGCAPLAGYAVYLWHATQDGQYSMYTEPNQNYLRGVQVSDADGWVTFTTVFPGCYSGRWPHMHFEIFKSLDDISNASNAVLISQLALPEDACDEVYAVAGYETSVSNFSRLTLASDGVFKDGVEAQLATVTGSPAEGMEATLDLGVR